MIKHIHPFPARMAPELVFEALPRRGSVDVLDPMMGSGTTLILARLKGHRATGVDRDPLAVLLAKAGTRDLRTVQFTEEAQLLLRRAVKIESQLDTRAAYPDCADEETKRFIRYWFDRTARRQLCALTAALMERSYKTSAFLKCAISRMIITKQGGVSLAEDVSHSRPHRTREVSPTTPFELFERSVQTIARNATFKDPARLPVATIRRGDSRALPFEDQRFDYLVTSPPYLNAIDYMRGHKLSLVWFGYSIETLRNLRSTNVGSSCGLKDDALDDVVDRAIGFQNNVTSRLRNMLRLYVRDLDESIDEMVRVLKIGGKAIFVIGDCSVRGLPVQNSLALKLLAERHGMTLTESPTRRPLPVGKRYLPPPRLSSGTTTSLDNRMWDEVILKFIRT